MYQKSIGIVTFKYPQQDYNIEGGKENMVKHPVLLNKTLIIGIFIIIVGMSINPSTGTVVEKVSSTIRESPGYIQDLIDNASNGDTIHIPSGTYYENIIINKSISIIGEDKNTTIIDGFWNGNGVIITADWVNLSGFTIRNCGYDWEFSGIKILRSSYNTIVGNIISENNDGITLDDSSNNIISDNIILNNFHGIIIGFLYSCHNNTINGNNISNNNYGIGIDGSDNNVTGNNIMSNKEIGIYLWFAPNNTIYHNNFINNTNNANNEEGYNIWDDGKYGNYWSDYKERYPKAKRIWLKGIWNTPYEIPGGDNKDNCPLINQWPKSRTKTRTTSYFVWYHWFLERFPLLERLLTSIINS